MKFSISEKHPEEHGGDKTLDVIETHGAPTCGAAHNCRVVYMIKYLADFVLFFKLVRHEIFNFRPPHES